MRNFTNSSKNTASRYLKPVEIDPLTLARIAEMERERGIKFPAFYKEFLSRYGAGYIRDVLVLSPDSKSEFKVWETSGRVENRECNFMGVIEYESDYYGFLIEQGTCSNDIWNADHDFGYEIADSDYSDFFDLLAKLGLGFWDDEDEDDEQ